MSSPTRSAVGVRRRSRRTPTGGRRSVLGPILFAGPATIWLGALILAPLGYGVYLSLCRWNLTFSASPSFTGISNYSRILGDPLFWDALIRTIIWTGGSLVIELAVGVPLGLLFSRRTRVSGTVTGIALVPWVTPFAVMAYTWVLLYDGKYGAFHSILQSLGLVGAGSSLADPAKALGAIILVSGWKGIPIMMIVVLSSRIAIPDELYEAARVDGAGPSQIFRRITLPLILPGIGGGMAISAIFAFYNFDLPWLMTKGGPGDATTILGILLYRTAFHKSELGQSAAVGVLMLLVLIITYIAIQAPRRLISRARSASGPGVSLEGPGR